ncbi:MAG TPA: NTF2 fold immunity protein [Rhizomicrobium sp.]
MSADQENLSVTLQRVLRGGIVDKPSVARDLAEIILKSGYGKRELDRQRPLVVKDRGDFWQIDGSYNRERRPGAKGSVMIQIAKTDGRVIRIELPIIMGVPGPAPQ